MNIRYIWLLQEIALYHYIITRLLCAKYRSGFFTKIISIIFKPIRFHFFSTLNMTFSPLSSKEICSFAHSNLDFLWCGFKHGNKELLWLLMYLDSKTFLWTFFLIFVLQLYVLFRNENVTSWTQDSDAMVFAEIGHSWFSWTRLSFKIVIKSQHLMNSPSSSF